MDRWAINQREASVKRAMHGTPLNHLWDVVALSSDCMVHCTFSGTIDGWMD